MKILYAVQATGNGHISRAMQLMPYLQQYGNVDVFLSGSNSHLNPELPVKYRSNGLSLFYGNTGGLDYLRIWKELHLKRIWREAKDLPVEKYDLVLNDFDSITALSCKLKGVKSIGFGHQASFQSKHTPRPDKKDIMGEWILRNYAKADQYIGLHFKQYDEFIYSPVIKEEIIKAQPTNGNYITVYLSHYADEVLMNALQGIKDVQFEVFSKKVTAPVVVGNVRLMPISNDGFTNSMIHSLGVITGAGFETPAEALYLGKKLLVLPIRGQYEQHCNAAALKELGVPVIPAITSAFAGIVSDWIQATTIQPLTLQQTTYEIVQTVMELGRSIVPKKEHWLSEEDFATLF